MQKCKVPNCKHKLLFSNGKYVTLKDGYCQTHSRMMKTIGKIQDICPCGKEATYTGYCKKCNFVRKHSNEIGYKVNELTIVSFSGMNDRVKNLERYRKLGIEKEWTGKNGLKNFVTYLHKSGIGLCPEEYDENNKRIYSIDRIDNNKGYFKGNIRWATNSEQSINQRHRDGMLIEYEGKKLNSRQWSEISGVPQNTIFRRYKLGWKPEDAIFGNKNFRQYVGSYENLTPTKIRDIVRAFQYDVLYDRELALLKNPEIVKKLDENRQKYIHKSISEMTEREVLNGMKISGICYSYSRFNAKSCFEFIEKYSPSFVYDPCGGWGERMIAFTYKNIKYHYNDISNKAKENVDKIAKFLKVEKLYSSTCEDSSKLNMTNSQHDAVFTCPPYWNKEIYTDKGSENLSYEEFIEWWKKTVNNSISKNTKYFCYVMTEKFLDDMNSVIPGKLIEKREIFTHISHFGKRNYNEFIVVFSI